MGGADWNDKGPSTGCASLIVVKLLLEEPKVKLIDKNGALCLFLYLNFSKDGRVSDREYVQFGWNRINWANSTTSFTSICLSDISELISER